MRDMNAAEVQDSTFSHSPAVLLSIEFGITGNYDPGRLWVKCGDAGFCGLLV